MNGELRDILKANIGRIVRIYFHGIGDDTYGSGVIKEVTNSILTFELRIREDSGVEYDTITYHDIGQIRTVTFHEYRATRRHLRSVANAPDLAHPPDGKPKHVDHSRCLAGTLRRNRGQAGRVQQSKSGANAGGNQQKRKYHPNISIGCRY